MKSFFKNLLKDDPIQSSLTKLLLFTESPTSLNLPPLLRYYAKTHQQQKQEQLIQHVIVQLQKRKSMLVKLKIFMYLFSLSKLSSFDIPQLITRKKLKLFREEDKKQYNLTLFDLSPITKQSYLHKFILLALYNYMIKLSTNQQLYRTCLSGIVPQDEIFRKGYRIRYIWVFKIFNLLNLLLPLLTPILILIDKFPKETMFIEILVIIKQDIAIYFNFITKCIQQTSTTNIFLLPYNDCLQYYECVKEYQVFRGKNEKLLKQVGGYVKEHEIRYWEVDEEMFAELEVLALRIQIISTGLKSGGAKRNEKMVTEYSEKAEKYEIRVNTLEN